MNELIYNGNTPPVHLSVNDLRELEGDARIQDLRLAEILGYGKSYDIRKLIKRNEAKLLKYGVLSTVATTSSSQGGAPTAEYWLNQGQAIRIVTLSETERADDATKQVIDVYIAYRKGLSPVEENPDLIIYRGYTELLKKVDYLNQTAVPKAEAYDRIAQSDGSLALTDAAKVLGMARIALINWMLSNRWMYRRLRSGELVGYDSHTKNGDLEHTLVEYDDKGKTRSKEQVLVTVRGIAKLAKIFSNAAA